MPDYLGIKVCGSQWELFFKNKKQTNNPDSNNGNISTNFCPSFCCYYYVTLLFLSLGT